MIGYFPELYPDEIFYSGCARFSNVYKFPSNRIVLHELFSAPRNFRVTIEFPTRLGAFVKNLPPGHSLTTESIIENHSFYPYYRPFVPQEYLQKLEQFMIFNTKNEKSFRTAFSSKNISLNKWLRYCPICIEEDRKKYGEAYWHRTHQLFGVLTCPEHEVYLENSNINVSSYEKKGSTSFESLEKQNFTHVTPRTLSLSDFKHKHLLMISRFSQSLLTNSMSGMGFKEIKERFGQELHNAGYARQSGIKDSRRLVEDFEKFYTHEFLNEISCGFDEISRFSWPAKITNSSPRSAHPLYHILMMCFLGYGTFQSFSQAKVTQKQYFGEGPWLCENPICEKYKQAVITRYELDFRNSPERKTPYGTFSCESCGFTYTVCGSDNKSNKYKGVRVIETGALWDKKLAELWHDPNAKRRTVTQTLGYSWDVIIRQAARLALPYPPAGFMFSTSRYYYLNNDGDRNNLSREIEQMRKKWMDALETNPEKSVTQLCGQQELRRVYKRLHKIDHDWIMEHRPGSKLRKAGKGFDWSKRDELLVEDVRNAITSILEQPGKPTHVTLSEIRRHMNYPEHLLKVHLSRLPRTRYLLEEVVESRVAFYERRIAWAKSLFLQQGRCPTRDEFCREVGISTFDPDREIRSSCMQTLQYLRQVLGTPKIGRPSRKT